MTQTNQTLLRTFLLAVPLVCIIILIIGFFHLNNNYANASTWIMGKNNDFTIHNHSDNPISVHVAFGQKHSAPIIEKDYQIAAESAIKVKFNLKQHQVTHFSACVRYNTNSTCNYVVDGAVDPETHITEVAGSKTHKQGTINQAGINVYT